MPEPDPLPFDPVDDEAEVVITESSRPRRQLFIIGWQEG
jgi:hypothetical protein